MEAPRTANGFDALLAAAVVALTLLEASHASTVKAAKAEHELLSCVEAARDFMLEVLKNQSDRVLLIDIFGGDCIRIARIRAVCESSLQELHSRCAAIGKLTSEIDHRLSICINACESIERVIEDLGLGDRLKAAQVSERAAMETKDDGSSDDCIQHVAGASVSEAQAIHHEREGDTARALEHYSACRAELLNAIATVPEAGEASGDAEKLQAHLLQVEKRIEYLEGLNGDAPTVPVEDQIQSPPDLAIQQNTKTRSKLVTACATIGAAGGFVMLGPLGAVLAASAGAAAAKRDDDVGERVRAIGEAAYRKTQEARDMAANTKIDEKLGIVDKLSTGFHVATSKTAALNQRFQVSDRIDQKLGLVDNLSAGYQAASTRKAALDQNLKAGATKVSATAADVVGRLGTGLHKVTETASAIDQRLKVSETANALDQKFKVSQTATAIDQKFKVSETTSAIDERFQVSNKLDRLSKATGDRVGKLLSVVGIGSKTHPSGSVCSGTTSDDLPPSEQSSSERAEGQGT